MRLKGNYYFWLALLIAVALAFWWYFGKTIKKTTYQVELPSHNSTLANSTSRVQNSTQRVKRESQARYVPANDASLHPYEYGADFVLMGKISTSSGDAISGAIVKLYGPRPVGSRIESSPSIINTDSDREGHYFVRYDSSISNGRVTVEKQGFASIESPLSMREPGTTIKNFELASAACVQGTVFSSDGAPISGASVRFFTSSLGTQFCRVQIFSDREGAFKSADVAEGPLLVNVDAKGFAPIAKTVIAKGPCERIDFHINPAKSVYLVVKDKLGSLIQNAVAVFTPYLKDDSPTILQRTENGMLEWILPVGFSQPADCMVMAPGYKNKRLTLDPRIEFAVVVLEDAEIIRGRVVSESGQPVPGARVDVLSGGVADTDSDGTFSIPARHSILTNSFIAQHITVKRTGYVEKQVDLEDSIPVSLTIRLKRSSAGLFGRVIDTAGKPIQRFVITLTEAAESNPEVFSRRFDDEEGRFFVGDVPPGVYSAVFETIKQPPIKIDLLGLEVKDGLYLGEILVSLPSTAKK
jgi:hypothetical protein